MASSASCFAEVKRIELGPCYTTVLCRHEVTIEWHDGTQSSTTLTGRKIARLYRNCGLHVPRHIWDRLRMAQPLILGK